ncbi:ATP-binding protein [Alkalicella caledoniensis]|uniref:ATP-binding protein n=1 Tax=Alkalicella caledoniensis TaxID=2731377 RepID=A0A7G9W3Q6_ALKCA|nr:ATP-binding protein [Alkalicella caledoniensis]QNO13318.1 ATP-binding protein [Alkalicella caledoniensis]
MYTEIVKIIEGGMIGDKEKVYNYAQVLAENLEKSGDASLAKKIRSLLVNKKTRMASLDDFSTKPVDTESRMDMVDIFIPDKSFEAPILKSYIHEEIDEFIHGYEERDEILRAGIEMVSSLLLYGPPGCGKTTVARFIAYKTGLPLVTVRLDGLVSSLLGSTAKNIRKIFDYASKRDCILFLDEFDVVAKLRDDKHELGELKRVVNSLLQNIDDFSQNSILIAATNHHELLDPAVWRRFSKIITLEKPNKEEIMQLIKLHVKSLKSNVVENDKKLEMLAAAFEGISHADVKTVVNNTIKKSIINKKGATHNWDMLQEVYLYRNHKIISENEFIKYLLQYGVTQKEVSDNFNYSLRKVRDVASSPE